MAGSSPAMTTRVEIKAAASCRRVRASSRYIESSFRRKREPGAIDVPPPVTPAFAGVTGCLSIQTDQALVAPIPPAARFLCVQPVGGAVAWGRPVQVLVAAAIVAVGAVIWPV